MTTDELTVAGTPPAKALGRYSWALFDWAAQPFFTLIITFIFAPYFTGVVVGDSVLGQSYWGYGQAVAGATIAILSPILGAIADAGGPRKPWIGGFVLPCVFGSALLWWAVPGMSGPELTAILAYIVIATIGIEFAGVFNNAMLPGLVLEKKIGRLSGFAWGLGYVGGLIALFIVLFGFTLPDQPLLGLDKAMHEHDRIVGPLSAVWLAIFCLPLLLFTPDEPTAGLSRMEAARQGLRQLKGTLTRLGRYRNVVRFLAARMIYNDAIAAVIGFSGIYAKGLFGWSTTDLGVFAIIVTVVAAVGAFIGGWLDDKIGSRRTVIWMVVCLTLGTLGIVSVGADTAFFFVSFGAPPAEAGFMTTPAQWVFLAFGLLVGFGFGPAQAASRTMMARLAPPELMTEFFGLYALSGKATAFLAPLTIALVTDIFSSQRAGLAVIIVFFIVGLALFLPVREERTDVSH